MILVDTNVVSETMRRNPDSAVISWLDRQLAETLYLSSVSLAELLLGVAALPDGRRKNELRSALNGRAKDLFGQRILPFDQDAAVAFADIMSAARAVGRPIGLADGQIAAIAKANQLIVATRDTAPFAAAGLTIVNPWSPKAE